MGVSGLKGEISLSQGPEKDNDNAIRKIINEGQEVHSSGARKEQFLVW